MIDPAPKVDAASAEPARPQEAAAAEKALASSAVQVDKAPSVSIVHAEPPSEVGALSIDKTADVKHPPDATLIKSLRASNKIIFDSVVGIIPGEAEKNMFQKMFPRLLDERSCVSFGEVKRYIVVVDGSCYIFADETDPSPLYSIELTNLHAVKEDANKPHFRSHTVSPEANTGLPKANQSRETLETVLLFDKKGKIVFQLTFDSHLSGKDVVVRFLNSIAQSKSKSIK
jgi:hypothetical protein